MELTKDNVLKYISDHGQVTFIELQKNFDNTEGEYDFAIPNYDNIRLWFGMTKEFIDIMHNLLAEKKIDMLPSDIMVYAFDGGTPIVPIARSKRQYKKPRWLPVIFNAVSKNI